MARDGKPPEADKDPTWESDSFLVPVEPRKDGDQFPLPYRIAFVKAIRNGCRTRQDAAKILPGVKWSTVVDWLNKGRKPRPYVADDQIKVEFYRQVIAAEAARDSVADTVIMREVQRGNYKAADLWLKRSERMRENPYRERILAAEAAEREAAAAAAKHRERILALQADIMARKDEASPDMVLLPPHAVERLKLKNPTKAAQLQQLLEEANMVMAPSRVVDAVVKGHDDHMAAENDRLAKDLGIDVAPPIDVDAEDVSGDQG